METVSAASSLSLIHLLLRQIGNEERTEAFKEIFNKHKSTLGLELGRSEMLTTSPDYDVERELAAELAHLKAHSKSRLDYINKLIAVGEAQGPEFDVPGSSGASGDSTGTASSQKPELHMKSNTKGPEVPGNPQNVTQSSMAVAQEASEVPICDQPAGRKESTVTIREKGIAARNGTNSSNSATMDLSPEPDLDEDDGEDDALEEEVEYDPKGDVEEEIEEEIEEEEEEDDEEEEKADFGPLRHSSRRATSAYATTNRRSSRRLGRKDARLIGSESEEDEEEEGVSSDSGPENEELDIDVVSPGQAAPHSLRRSRRGTLTPTAANKEKITGKKSQSRTGKKEVEVEVWCSCRQPSHGDMIGCDNDDCEIQWFHFKCVGIRNPAPANWMCNTCLLRSGLSLQQYRRQKR